jgi:putative oxidoreductase
MRVVIALMLLQHGGQKLFGYPAIRVAVSPPFSERGIAGMVELGGGLLVLLGLFTRPAAFILFLKMVATYFMQYASDAWWPIHNLGELAVIYSFVFLYLSAAGPGPFSLDYCIRSCCAPPPPAPSPAPPPSAPPPG